MSAEPALKSNTVVKRRPPLVAAFVALRPKQWTKNLLLFPGLLFTLDTHHAKSDLLHTVIGFFLFSFLSGATYIVNDIADIRSDRLHPTKRYRPIPSGDLSITAAFCLASVLFVVSLYFSFVSLGLQFGADAAAYVVLTLAYSFLLKHIVIIDLLVLASGFVLRAIAGAAAIHVQMSSWFVLCVLLLALFLGIGKRRGELVAVQSGRRGSRPILNEYSPELLDQMSTIVTSALLMCYALYTVQSQAALQHHYLLFTIPFVLYGIFRYLYLIHLHNQGEAPDELVFKDRPLLICIFLWAIAVAIIVTRPG